MDIEGKEKRKKFSSKLSRLVKKRLPILSWLPEYNLETLVCDMIAGLTVGLTVMPQGLAYATLAGLEPQYGLYSAFMGCFVYAIFGSCKDITIGPTALMSLMTYQQILNKNVDFAILLCFLSGLVQILMSVLHLGSSYLLCFMFWKLTAQIEPRWIFTSRHNSTGYRRLINFDSCWHRESRSGSILTIAVKVDETSITHVFMTKNKIPTGVLIDFISIPVTVGFTSATSVIIATSQMKGLLGLKFKSSGFIDTVKNIGLNIKDTKLHDSVLGFSCIAILLLIRKAKDLKFGSKGEPLTRRQEIIKKCLWLFSTSRNALIVLLCSLLSYFLYDKETETSPFVLTGIVKSGLPEFRPPNFSTVVGNKTYSFTEMSYEMGSAIIMVPVIAVLGNVAIAKAFASGNSVDATQELLTLGFCNLFGSFVSSMPVTGSFSRSAVNHASGVKTPLGGVYTGAIILLALSTLTPYFFFIPKASLAAVIICAVIFMIEYEVVKPMWRSNRKDLIPTFATFILCLVIGVEYGILIGVLINIMFLLYPSARPKVRVEKSRTSQGTEYLLVTPGNSLYFPSVYFIRTSVYRAAAKEAPNLIPVVIDCRYVLDADFTAAKGIAALIADFNKRKQPIYFYQPCASVVSVFKGACIEEFVHVCSEEELDHMFGTKQQKKKEEFPLIIDDIKEASRLLTSP